MQNIRDLTKKTKRTKKGKSSKEKKDLSIMKSPFFKKVKPKENYLFFSDYFKIDDEYATILTIFHTEGADDKLGYFWGISLIPSDLDSDVSVRKMTQVARQSESWIMQHQGKAEGLLSTNESQVRADGSFKAQATHTRKQQSLIDIAQELMSGGSYLRVSMRLFVKAPNLNKLDDAVERINRQYLDRFETVHAEPYVGEQRGELSNLLRRVDAKQGKNFMFTSTEFAGNYDLVTHGIEDANGEYLGQMRGDVNNSAIIMDLDDYDHHVVLAGANQGQTLSRLPLNGEMGVDVWGAKLGMSALMNNRQVVHLVLNGSDIAKIGVNLDDITANVSMDGGDINFLEMFGDIRDELSIFPAHLQKIVLMAEQVFEPTDSDRSIIRGSLQDVLTEFYIDQGMWVENAQHNRERLRLVGIPHTEVPKLPQFLAYLDMRYKAELNKGVSGDKEMVHAYNVLRQVFSSMLSNNGDLFNTHTSNIIDRAKKSQRVIYDFSSLIRRGRGLMMAQFINALGFSVGNLTRGDVLLIHGADQLDPSVMSYVREQLELLTDGGVRIVYIYTNIDRMIEQRVFNQFDQADYTILGPMTETTLQAYESSIAQDIPLALKNMLVQRSNLQYYLRRRFDNLVFTMDVQLGIDRE